MGRCGDHLWRCCSNALLGFIQEGKAEKALDSIRNMLSAEAGKVRGGETRMIATEQQPLASLLRPAASLSSQLLASVSGLEAPLLRQIKTFGYAIAAAIG